MVKKYLLNKLIISITILFATSNSFAIGEQALAQSMEREKAVVSRIKQKLDNPKTLESGLSELEKYISTGKITPAVLQAKILYSTVVLDKVHKQPFVKNAIKYILPLAIEKELSEYQFVTANLLFLNEQFDMADSFLQLACTNKKADKKILQMCNDMSHIEHYSASDYVSKELKGKNIKEGSSCLK